MRVVGEQNRIKHLDFILLDLILAIVALVGAYYLRHLDFGIFQKAAYVHIAVLLLIAAFISGFFFDLYKNILKRGNYKELGSVVEYCLVDLMFIIFFLFFSKSGDRVSRVVIFYMMALELVIIYVERLVWKAFLRRHLSRDRKQRMLVLAHSSNVLDTLESIEKYPLGDAEVVGVVTIDDGYALGENLSALLRQKLLKDEWKEVWDDDVHVVSDFDDAVSYIRTEWVDSVYIDLPGEISVSEMDMEILLEACAAMGVTTHRTLMRENGRNVVQSIDKVAGNVVLTERMIVVSSTRLFQKRLLDIVGALVGLVITAILAVLVGPFIFFADPGPIIFKQKRVGRNGRIFDIYKFRSMYKDAERRKQELMEKNTMKGLMFKMDNDPRILGSGPDGTRKGIGWLIRKTSIDEFPQFLNVLKGDMSLVGTRPPTVDEWEKYELHHRARLVMKPGITGLWQTSGRNSITDFEEVIKLDVEYINSWTIFGDIKLIGKTLLMMIVPNGK